MQAVEALQFHFTTLLEVDLRASDEIVNDVRNEYLAAEGLAGDACRVMDCGAEEVVAFVDGVAGVNSDPYGNRRRDISECEADRALDPSST